MIASNRTKNLTSDVISAHFIDVEGMSENELHFNCSGAPSWSSKNMSQGFRKRMEDAVSAVLENKVSQNKAAKDFGVSREALQRHVKAARAGPSVSKVGRPNELSAEEENVLALTVQTVTEWGFGLTKTMLQDLVQRYLETSGKDNTRFRNNRPGIDWVESFMTRKKLVLRQAGNIKRSRASLNEDILRSFFTELQNCGIGDIQPSHII